MEEYTSPVLAQTLGEGHVIFIIATPAPKTIMAHSAFSRADVKLLFLSSPVVLVAQDYTIIPED